MPYEWESWPWPSPTAALYRVAPLPCLVNTLELVLVGQVWWTILKESNVRELTTPLAAYNIWWASQWVLESSLWCWGPGRAGKLTNPAISQTENQAELGHPHIHPIEEAYEGGSPAHPKWKDLYGTEQQQDIKKESQWQSGVYGITQNQRPQTRPMIAMNNCKQEITYGLNGIYAAWLTVSHYCFLGWGL